MALAGLYDQWEDQNETLTSFAVLTRSANKFMSTIHDRMPVVLENRFWELWLDEELRDEDAIRTAIDAAEESSLMCRPVDPKMGSIKIQGPSVLNSPVQATLDL